MEGCQDKSPQQQAALDSLCRVLDTAGQLCMHTAVLHPTNMQKLIAATLDDGRSGVSGAQLLLREGGGWLGGGRVAGRGATCRAAAAPCQRPRRRHLTPRAPSLPPSLTRS